MNTSSPEARSGFTLIEIVLVIAVLGILALIAIPRYSGFTAKAKEATDTQYATLVANATLTLLAEGTFRSEGTVEIANNGSLTSPSVDEIDGFDAAEIYKIVAQKPLKTAGRTYAITFDADCSYTIELP